MICILAVVPYAESPAVTSISTKTTGFCAMSIKRADPSVATCSAVGWMRTRLLWERNKAKLWTCTIARALYPESPSKEVLQ